MSTKATLKSRSQIAGSPGFHLYEETALDSSDSEDEPVYLQVDGVAATVQTLKTGGASVTMVLPRELARELGLLPDDVNSNAVAD